jgi:hypothetical protein
LSHWCRTKSIAARGNHILPDAFMKSLQQI